MLNQSTWRRIGAATISLAALMAVYAVAGGILRDTALHLARMFSEQAAQEATADKTFLFCLTYWIIFSLLTLSSLYMAVLDIRFIRLQFALEKRELLRENLGDAALHRNLVQKQANDAGEETSESHHEPTSTGGQGEP